MYIFYGGWLAATTVCVLQSQHDEVFFARLFRNSYSFRAPAGANGNEN